MTRHLLSAADLTRDEATAILDDADRFREALVGREVKKLPTLRGRTVITMFYENSTRTRVSFEVAGKWMSADVINVSASGSSVAKGESLRDTALTLRAAGADALIIRHPASGAAQQLSEWTAEKDGAGPSVINAGDGTHEHPTQALLDALTIRQRLGGIEGRRVVIVGDVLHSRVARSNVLLLATLGAEVVLVAPPTLLPVGVADWPVSCFARPRRRTARCRRGVDVAGPGRADERRLLPVRPGVLGALRPLGEAVGDVVGQCRGTAPGADVARHGDLVTGGGLLAIGSAATGFQRRARTHGGAVPLVGRVGTRGDQRMTQHIPESLRSCPPFLIRGVRRYGEGDPVDVLVEDGQLADIGTDLTAPDGAEVIDASGQVLLPGFVDLHTHLREPGREYAEDIETGSAAAALGGYTAVFAMANTTPVADSPVVTDHVWHRGQQVGLVDVHPVGAVTVGLAGAQLTEMGMMAAGAGQVRMFSDDGVCVDDPLIMRRALEYATGLGVLIAQHAEEPRLTVGAVAHEGPNAARLGLAGWPRAAEESIVARDALLARDAGARVHICHASTAGTVELVRWAKEQGISITAEVTPHHLLLDDTRLDTYDGRNRVNPPLREASDALALRQALADGVIDCVATDHAPHAEHEKMCEFASARPGMLGLQTALSVVVETMLHTDLLTWRDVARVMSEAPARIVGLPDHGRPLEVGEPANLTVVDPDAMWTVDGAALASRSDNTPYESMALPAVVTLTMLRGKITARDGKSPA